MVEQPEIKIPFDLPVKWPDIIGEKVWHSAVCDKRINQLYGFPDNEIYYVREEGGTIFSQTQMLQLNQGIAGV